MTAQTSTRSELADFLRSRRRQVDPELAGLPMTGRRRTPGLRREEVCLLSGVGLTWYTWLEQGRDIHPSRQVIDALARTLNLSRAEGEYLRALAGYPTTSAEDLVQLPDHGQRVLDALGASPAYATTRDWSIVGWNSAYAHFYAGVVDKSPADRNLLWLLWTDAEVQNLLADWPTDSRRFLATFRAESGAHLHEPIVRTVVDRLHETSTDFAAAWASHDIDRFTSRNRNFNHPMVGPLTLEHHQLTLTDCPDLHLIVYTAKPGSVDERRLKKLSQSHDVGAAVSSPTE